MRSKNLSSSSIGTSFVDVSGIRTRYYGVTELKDIPAVVFIHGGQYGNYYSAYAWRLNVEGLGRRGYRTLAFDKLGMGYTANPPSDDEYTIGATIKHAEDFLQSMGVKSAVLVGHSRGALVSARIAVDRPDLVKKLVIVDSASLTPADVKVQSEFYDKLEREAPDKESMESASREARANSYSSEHVTKEFAGEMYRIATLPKTLEARWKMNNMGLVRALFLPSVERERDRLLGDIEGGSLKKIPVLIVWGWNDPSAPVNLGWGLFSLFSRHVAKTQFHVFNHAGHYSFREHPEQFNSLLDAFIQGE